METRLIKYRINIYPSDLVDIDASIQKKIESIFVGKCIQNIYVKNIIRITKMGEITSYMYSNNAMHTLDVEVEVLGLCYREGDIIHYAVMHNRDNNISTFTEEAAIIMSDNKDNPKIKTGDIFPLIVRSTEYLKFSPKININATRYSKSNKTVVYYSVKSEGRYDEMINLNILKIKELYEEILNLDQKIVEEFENILFVHGNIKYKNAVNILDMAKNYQDYGEKIIISYPTIIGKTSKVLVYKDSEIEDFQEEVKTGKIDTRTYKINVEKDLPIDFIVLRLTRNYVINLELIKAMSEKFHTKELINSNSNVWKLI